MLRTLAGSPSRPARAAKYPFNLLRLLRKTLTLALSGAIVFASMPPRPAEAGTRTLSFKQMHTGERLTVTYKRNGRFDPEAMKKINYILRDWRRNETIKMDPKLIDLVWEVQHQMGATQPVHVLSGYRSPVTNAALRRRGRGVARKSQHTLGKALDFYIPGVSLKKMRETAMRMQRGGVGFYPNSGAPFMHVDTARVRSWPRMTRQQLARVFPDGETLHLPTNGRPLKGYKRAQRKARNGRLAIYVNAEDGAGTARTLASADPATGQTTTRPAAAQPRQVAQAPSPAASQAQPSNLPDSAPVPPQRPTGVALYAALDKPVPAPPVNPLRDPSTQLAAADIPTQPQPQQDTRPQGVLREDTLVTGNQPLVLASNTPPLPPNRPLPPAPPGFSGDQIAQQIWRGDSVAALAPAAAPAANFPQLPGGTAPRMMAQPVLAMITRAWSLFSDTRYMTIDDSGVAEVAGLTHDPAFVLTHSFAGPAVVRVAATPFAGRAIEPQPFHRVAFTASGDPTRTASIR